VNEPLDEILSPEEIAKTGVLHVFFRRRGQPLPGLVCELRTYASSVCSRVISDEAGRAEFTGFEAGLYRIVTSVMEAKLYRLSAEEVTRVTIEVPEMVAVDGRVLGEDGQPFQAAEICLSLFGEADAVRVVAQSDHAGRFQLDALVEGSHLFARAPGKSRSNVILVDEARSRGEVLFRLRGARSYAGTVVDPKGRPVPAALVRVGSAESLLSQDSGGFSTGMVPTSWATTTDEQGRFLVPDVNRDREYPVTVQARGFALFQTSGGAPEETLHIRLDDECILRGRVVDERGQSIPEAFVKWGDDLSFVRSRTRVDEEGRFEMRGLPREDLTTIRVGCRGYAPRRIELGLSESEHQVTLVRTR